MTHLIKSSLTAGHFAALKSGTTYNKIKKGALEDASRQLCNNIYHQKIRILPDAKLTSKDDKTIYFQNMYSAEQQLAFVDQMVDAHLTHFATRGNIFVGKGGLDRYKGWTTHRLLKQEIWNVCTNKAQAKKPLLSYAMPDRMPALAQDLAFYHFARKCPLYKDNGITAYKTLDAFAARISKLPRETSVRLGKRNNGCCPSIKIKRYDLL